MGCSDIGHDGSVSLVRRKGAGNGIVLSASAAEPLQYLFLLQGAQTYSVPSTSVHGRDGGPHQGSGVSEQMVHTEFKGSSDNLQHDAVQL